jgi:hypothetical protein
MQRADSDVYRRVVVPAEQPASHPLAPFHGDVIMAQTALPKCDLENSETGCCPRFDPSPWDEREFEFRDRLFVRDRTVNFLHIPLNMGAMVKRTWSKIQAAGAASDEFVILSTDPSPWRGEHYFSVSKEVPGADNVRLSGTYVTKVFEGPYRDAGKWVRETQSYVESQNKTLQKLYFFYTTCPKCAKHYGKNYVVAFAEV